MDIEGSFIPWFICLFILVSLDFKLLLLSAQADVQFNFSRLPYTLISLYSELVISMQAIDVQAAKLPVYILQREEQYQQRFY